MLLRHLSRRVPPAHVEVYVDVHRIVVASDSTAQGHGDWYDECSGGSGWWPSEGGKEVRSSVEPLYARMSLEACERTWRLIDDRVARRSQSSVGVASRVRSVCYTGFAGFAVWAILHRV